VRGHRAKEALLGNCSLLAGGCASSPGAPTDITGVRLVISDAHEGLKAAVARVLHARSAPAMVMPPFVMTRNWKRFVNWKICLSIVAECF
jgi:hypothetical protein